MEARSRRRRKQTTTKMNLQNLLTAFSWKHAHSRKKRMRARKAYIALEPVKKVIWGAKGQGAEG
jgi:hypothetical protein